MSLQVFAHLVVPSAGSAPSVAFLGSGLSVFLLWVTYFVWLLIVHVGSSPPLSDFMKRTEQKDNKLFGSTQWPSWVPFNPVLLWFSCCTHTYNHKLLCLVCFFSPKYVINVLICTFGQEAVVLLSILHILTASKNISNKMWKKLLSSIKPFFQLIGWCWTKIKIKKI